MQKTEKITAFWTNSMMAIHSLGIVVLYSSPFLVIFGAVPWIPGATFTSATGVILLKLVTIMWNLSASAFWLLLIQAVVPVTPLVMSEVWTMVVDAASANVSSFPRESNKIPHLREQAANPGGQSTTVSTHEHASNTLSPDHPVASTDLEDYDEPASPKRDSIERIKAVVPAFLRLACAIWVINRLKPLAFQLIGLVINSMLVASKILTKTIIYYVLIYVFVPISPLVAWVGGPIVYQRIRSRSTPVNV
jgi:hypothetical protein